MIIKKMIMSGFKNVLESEPKEYSFFDNTTIIRGENFIGKTSIGDALCWVFTGASSTGITSEYILMNDKSKSMEVQVDFEDNNGLLHTLKRCEAKRDKKIYLDGIPIKEAKLDEFTGGKEVFLSTFMIGYFQRLSSKAAKDMLMNILPFPSNEEIIMQVGEDIRSYLPENKNFDSNLFLKDCRSKLKDVEEKIKNCKNKQNFIEERVTNNKKEELIDELELKAKLDSLESRKESLFKLFTHDSRIGYLEGNLSVVRLELMNIQNKKNLNKVNFNRICQTCGQPIPEEKLKSIEEKVKEENEAILKRVNELKCEEENLIKKINGEKDKTTENKAIMDELDVINKEIKFVKVEYEKIIRSNQTIKAATELINQNHKKLEELKIELEKLNENRYKLNRSIVAVSQYNIIKADKQYETIRGSLKNLSIKLQRVNQATNELRDCFEILYKGRALVQISTSENIRVGLEISNLINHRTGLKLPVFIDNAESITHYDKPDGQIFEAKVKKDSPLVITEV